MFVKSYVDSLELNSPSCTFPLFAKAIVIDKLQSEILLGLVFSMGALTESVVKSATKAFIKELQDMCVHNKDIFLKTLRQLLVHTRNNLQTQRLSISLIKTVDLIVQHNLLNDLQITE